MSVNRYRKHLLVLPEDAANVAIANGFQNSPKLRNGRVIQVLPAAKGWEAAVASLLHEQVPQMRQYQKREILLIIDFDEDVTRADVVRKRIPGDVQERIYILGVLSEPEKLKADFRMSFEQIGEQLASDCSENRDTIWSSSLLAHNKDDLARLTASFWSELFS